MISTSKQLLKSLFPKSALYWQVGKALVRDEDSYLHTTGWLRSLSEHKPVSPDGTELPWMNYPIIAFLRERLRPDLDLFEFGSGYSTMFYARRVRSVVSIEYDEAWFQRISQNLPANVQMVFKAQDVDGDYCRTITATGREFDVVIVDGRDRVNCVKQSIPALTASGVIVLDDSQRERYAEAFDHAKALGFSALSFEGIKPTGTELWRSTLLYRPGNCLGL